MEKTTILKLFVVFIAATFVIGMFTYFEREDIKSKTGIQNTNNVTESFGAAEGTALGKIQSFENIIYISPWNDSYKNILETLKSEKQVDYINKVDTLGIITLAPKANLSYIREKLEGINSDVFSEATILFSDQVNFTLLNGTTKGMSVGSTVAKLDPSTPVGELINARILADLSKTDIKNIKITLNAKINNVTQEVELNCSDSYILEGNLSWTNRNTNISKYSSLLNISESNIIYQKNEFVSLPRELNSTEIQSLKDKNLSFVNYILTDLIYINTTNKNEVENALSYLITNGTINYPNSAINITFEASKSTISDLVKELNKTIENINVKRNCGTNLSKITINGSKYYVEKIASNVEQYINIEYATDGTKNSTLEVYSIGRSINRINILDVK